MRIVQLEKRRLDKHVAVDKLERDGLAKAAGDMDSLKSALDQARNGRMRADDAFKKERMKNKKLTDKVSNQENELEAVKSTLARKEASVTRLEADLKKMTKQCGKHERAKADLEKKLAEVAARASAMSQEYSQALATAVQGTVAQQADSDDRQQLVQEFKFVKSQMAQQMTQALQDNRALEAELAAVKGVVEDLLGRSTPTAHQPSKPEHYEPADNYDQQAYRNGYDAYAPDATVVDEHSVEEPVPDATKGLTPSQVHSFSGAPHLDAKDLMTIDKQLNRAERKFNALDMMKTGLLGCDQILELAEWIWTTFTPGGYELYEETRHYMADRILERIDEDEQRMMSFDEFAAYFVRTSEAIMRYRKAHGQSAGLFEKGNEKQVLLNISVPTADEIEELAAQKEGDLDARYWYNYR